MRKKHAVIVCEAIAVCCPHCGEAQPNRDGSEMWTIDEYNAEFNDDRSVRRECVSCDKGFLLSPQKSAMMQK